MKLNYFPIIFFFLLLLTGCTNWRKPSTKVNVYPDIFPDYVGVTIPENIAPLNFEIEGAVHLQAVMSAGSERLEVSGDKYIDIALDDWQDLIKAALNTNKQIVVSVSAWTEKHPDGVEYKPFNIIVSADDVDGYVAYRLIPPGYESWSRMGIYQRDLSSFDESVIVSNCQNHNGCVNCHSFSDYNPEKGMMFHARGERGGTVIYQGGNLRKVALEQLGQHRSGTYPMWHPSGRFIVFSSNVTRQFFYGHSQDKIEVYDQASDLMIYDVNNNQVLTDERFTDSLNWETFPAFSSDGRWLYFCTAKAVKMPVEYNNLRYSICRVPFDDKTGHLGDKIDTVYSASRQGGSASFPRISPNGEFLLYTWADCATFPIHHKEADLKMIDLKSGNQFKQVDVSSLNSNDVDSYHSWSSNGKWVVLSSKRIDGRYTRLFLSHWDGVKFSKPLLIPQRNPDSNKQRMYSYNIPEFIKTPIDFNHDEMASLFKVE